MKRFASLFLVISLILALTACGTSYEPVPSTEEEARVIMTLEVGGEKYEIKYELYRAFFLTYKSEVDGGDGSVWSGADAAEYIDEINEIIVKQAAAIFAAIHAAEEIGFDPYGITAEDKIKEYVRVSVEGGTFGDVTVSGEESYENYLASLKEMNLNYSVQALLIRYSLATAALYEYYLGEETDVFDAGEGFKYDKEDVREYYFGDECASILQISLPDSATLKEIRDNIASQPNKNGVAGVMDDYVLDGDPNEFRQGNVLGRYELDRAYFSELTEAVFALGMGETSEPVRVGSGSEETHYITYRFAPDEAYYNSHYDLIAESFAFNALGKALLEAELALEASVTLTQDYSEIIHAEIDMD